MNRPESPSEDGYRLFVGAFVDGELGDQIQAIREHFDPLTARITPPHVTLAGLYTRSGPAIVESETETIHRLETLSGVLAPFDLRLRGIRTFPGNRPIVYLGVDVNQGLIDTRNFLMRIMGHDTHRSFQPHLTLAMRLPWAKAWKMVTDLQETPWNRQPQTVPVRQLRLMQRGTHDAAWHCIYTLVI